MRLTIVALSGIAAAALAFAALPADAAPKKRTQAASQNDVNVSSQSRRRARQTRPRTRITVRPRSFLDPGTDVLPGERKYLDYAIPPNSYSGLSVLDNTAFYHRSPLPGPFDLPGKNNPMQW
jgi:hypothetical protein